MEKYHLLLIFLYTIQCVVTILACPCMPSIKDSQPFFEHYEDSVNEEIEKENEE